MLIYHYAAEYYKIYNETFSYSKDWVGFIRTLHMIQFLKSDENNELKKKVDFFKKLCESSRIDYQTTERFLYSVDILTRTIPQDSSYMLLGNLTVDYTKILNKGLISLQKEIKNKISFEDTKLLEKSFLELLCDVLESVIVFRDRQLQHLNKMVDENPKNQNIQNLLKTISQVPLNPARTFQEALQSLLFINSLIWMDGHNLVGLGRLDQFLYPFLKRDLEMGVIGFAEARSLIKEFLKSINKYYKYKSNVLLGDTGQVIVLSGKNPDGSDATNQLTIMIMDVLKELKLPDPKVVLRVHHKTPEKVWEKAFQCLEEGLGYPLFSNDDVIIDLLVNFGYRAEDSFDYCTSACWEPLIPGKSLDQNNLATINFLEPLQRSLKYINHRKKEFDNFNSFFDFYKEFLKNYVGETIKTLDKIRFEPSPLLSLLVNDCVDNYHDISDGGARYNYFGLLSIGIGNTINALLNIKKLVFDKEEINLQDIFPILENNFKSNETLKAKLLNKGFKYGMDEDEVINLTNDLINTVQTRLNDFRNKYGFKYKFGLSSPGYISESADYSASFDGRMFNEPFGVHISPINTSNISYTSITNFASALSYANAFNGDVVDIIVEKGILKNFKDNFINYLKISFSKGVMQMQVNVLDHETLIKAKEHPELYPNLIVRVWGFSAYFKDLPEEYKDIIIKRALQYESQNHKYTTV